MYDYYDYEDLSGYKSEEWFVGWLWRQPARLRGRGHFRPLEWAESCVQAQKAGATIENILSLPESSKLGDEYLGGEHGDDGPESFKLNLRE